MVISKQVGYFDGSLKSVLSAVLLDFPPQFSIVFSSDKYLRQSVEHLVALLEFPYHRFVDINVERPAEDDPYRLVGLAVGVAEYLFGANVCHVPSTRHDMLTAERRRVHKFAYAEGEAAKRSEDGYFKVSTPLASHKTSYYVNKCLRDSKLGRVNIIHEVLVDAVKKSLSAGCTEHRDVHQIPCGECESCVWSYIHTNTFPELEVHWKTAPKETELFDFIVSSDEHDMQTSEEIEECQSL